jgi:hypothetical protein
VSLLVVFLCSSLPAEDEKQKAVLLRSGVVCGEKNKQKKKEWCGATVFWLPLFFLPSSVTILVKLSHHTNTTD